MAHKKGVGSTDNGRDSKSKRLGVKLFGGQVAYAGNIIIRQRGTKFHPGKNVYLGKDFSVHAKVDGIVKFNKGKFNRTFVNIIPLDAPEETVATIPPVVEPVKEAAPVAVAVEETPIAEAEAPVAEEETPVAVEETPEEAPVAAAPEVEEAPVEDAPVAEEKPKKRAKKIKQDDLKIIEGVGPKIESLLKEGGLDTWQKVADANPEQIKEILEAAGSRYRMHDPTTWPAQAKFAAEGKFDELKAWQDELDGGKA